MIEKRSDTPDRCDNNSMTIEWFRNDFDPDRSVEVGGSAATGRGVPVVETDSRRAPSRALVSGIQPFRRIAAMAARKVARAGDETGQGGGRGYTEST